MSVSSLNIRLFTKPNMIMGLIEYFNPILGAPCGHGFNEKFHITSQNLSFLDFRIFSDFSIGMKLLSSIIGVSHFFENANALTDDEVSAFGCREGIYYQYEKVSSNGGTAINQRASGKFIFLVFSISLAYFRR